MTRLVLSTTALGLAMTLTSLAATKSEMLTTYADIAAAGYQDSATAARTLKEAVMALTNALSAETLQADRAAWIAARVPYQQTEVYRFSSSIVEDWEGNMNAWPLDEGLIDYVDAGDGGASGRKRPEGAECHRQPQFNTVRPGN